MTASCVCVVYRRRRADADTHRPRRKVRDAVRRSSTQSYLVKAFLQPATERNHNHAHRTATRVRQMPPTRTERPTMPMPPSLRRCHQPSQHQTMAQAPSSQTAARPDLPARRLSSTRHRSRPRAATQPRRRPLELDQPREPVPRASHRQERRRCAARPNETTMTGRRVVALESLNPPVRDSAAVTRRKIPHNRKVESRRSAWVEHRSRSA
jgi:hypothetical protein